MSLDVIGTVNKLSPGEKADYLDRLTVLRVWLQSIFECQKCGTCCKKSDPVPLTAMDIERLARFLKKPLWSFIRKYTKTIPSTLSGCTRSLRRLKPCCFYDIRAGCKVYSARPTVCRVYPFMTGSSELVNFAITVPETCPEGVKLVEATRKKQQMIDEHPDIAAHFQSPAIRDGIREKAVCLLKAML